MSEQQKILVIDDLDDMRMILRITLERAGWQVIEGNDGQVAIELAQTHLPDVIVMDYNMPEMDGAQACQSLKDSEQTKHIPVIIYTGAYTDSVRQSAMSAGAADFLAKPILPNELRERVNAVYESHQKGA